MTFEISNICSSWILGKSLKPSPNILLIFIKLYLLNQNNPLRKISNSLRSQIESASALFWNYLGLFGDYGQKIFFLRITFFFFKMKSWNFQHLFENEFRETSLSFSSLRAFRQLLYAFFLLVVWLSWNFVRFHEIHF